MKRFQSFLRFQKNQYNISTLHLDSCSQKQEFDESYLGCGFPALDFTIEAGGFIVREKAEKIHAASLEILKTEGMRLHHPHALKLCTDHGFEIDGNLVRFKSERLMNLISKAPASFTLHARNPEFNMQMGSGKVNFAPGYGAPAVVESSARLEMPYSRIIKTF